MSLPDDAHIGAVSLTVRDLQRSIAFYRDVLGFRVSKDNATEAALSADGVATLIEHIAPGGYLHCATDWEPYAQQMLEVLTAEPGLVNTAEGYAETPVYRPLTKFENRGLKLGHGVWDLVFKKRES